MTTTPEEPGAETRPDDLSPDAGSGSPGAEIGISEGEGSSFEPEEDPEGHG
jgi:hypothetical protein